MLKKPASCRISLSLIFNRGKPFYIKRPSPLLTRKRRKPLHFRGTTLLDEIRPPHCTYSKSAARITAGIPYRLNGQIPLVRSAPGREKLLSAPRHTISRFSEPVETTCSLSLHFIYDSMIFSICKWENKDFPIVCCTSPNAKYTISIFKI